MSEQKLSTLLTDEVVITAYFDYQPQELETSTYPGCAAVAELNSVLIGTYDIMPVLSQSVLSALADKCLKSMEIDQ